MANFYSQTSTASAPTQVAVGATSTAAVSENYSRVGLILVNLSDSTMYIGFGATAVLGSGVVILPFGGAFSMNEFFYTKEAVNVIAHTADSLLAVQEFVVRA